MIPKISIGTYRVGNTVESIQTIKSGLELGFRCIDTAQVYKNEEMVAELKEKFDPEIFLISKISPSNQGDKAYSSILSSLKLLRVKCLDLMLIHWPGSSKLSPESPLNLVKRSETYQSLLKAKAQGLVKEIGVSNYTLKHLKELDVPPFLNQIEFHPLVYDEKMKKLLDYSMKNNIHVQAYSPLAEGKYLNGEWSDIVEIHEIAQKRSITPAQVLIKWALEKGVLVVVKSLEISRLKENFEAQNVILFQEDISILDSIITKYGYRKACWDPEIIL